MRALLTCALVLALAAPAAAQDQRIPYENNHPATAGDADTVIRYFNASGTGASATTTTYANRQEVWNLSIQSTSTSVVQIRLYSKASPGFDGTFSQDWNDDYFVVQIEAGGTYTRTNRSVPIIGWHIVTDTFTGTSPVVSILGWN